MMAAPAQLAIWRIITPIALKRDGLAACSRCSALNRFDMPLVSLNGFEMYYEVRGEREPLLLLHGGMGIGNDWRHIFAADPDGYRVIVPDLRGHGRSTNPAKRFTFRRCGRDLLALLDHLRIACTKAIGISMGA